MATAPTEFQVFPDGVSQLEGPEPKSAMVDDVARRICVLNFIADKKERVIDYEHQTLKGVQAPAAGWIKKLIDKGSEGLWASVVWTKKAKTYIENGEYRYFSPVFYIRKSDNRVVKILNIALTNFPRLNNLTPLTAKAVTLPMGAELHRLNEMMGIDTGPHIECAAGGPPVERMFESTEEKLNWLLPTN